MADYYSILGLDKQATQADIKSAFRKLAKQYHPDKNPNNPNANELFGAILKAYETLIDPYKKRRYDLYNAPGANTAQTTAAKPQGRRQKEWTFTEEDVKKRQYYQQYYKQKQEANKQATIPVKPYNDYKYILYATPIAVCLFMLIISLFTPKPAPDPAPATTMKSIRSEMPGAKTGDQVYAGWFGSIKTYGSTCKLSIDNSSDYDAVVAVFDYKTNKYIQHAFIQDGFYAEFSSLPQTGVYIRCILGRHWNHDRTVFNNRVQGCFDSIAQVQDWKGSPVIFNNTTGLEMVSLSVQRPGKNKFIETGGEELFFRK
jgi:curved DNA-binding protein CbpA